MRMRLEHLETVCIVDANGFPLALQRMDDTRFTGPQIAWNKAFTAAGHRRSTHLFSPPPDGPALPGNEGFGIQLCFEGRFAAFVGGLSYRHRWLGGRRHRAQRRLW